MNEKTAIDLKIGQTFKIKGKRKHYKVEGIFKDPLGITIYYKSKPAQFSRLRLSKKEIVIII